MILGAWVGAHRMRLTSHNLKQLSKLLCWAALLPEPPSLLHSAVIDSVWRTEKMISLMETHAGRNGARVFHLPVRPGERSCGQHSPLSLHPRRGTERGREVASRRHEGRGLRLKLGKTCIIQDAWQPHHRRAPSQPIPGHSRCSGHNPCPGHGPYSGHGQCPGHNPRSGHSQHPPHRPCPGDSQCPGHCRC